MTRITNRFIAEHFSADYVEDISGGWATIATAVLNARNIMAQPSKFPNANWDYLEKLDLEGTLFLLHGPIKHFV